jgi:hypothetical protein
MFKVVKIQTRPNTGATFWQGRNDPALTDEFRNYFYETYVLTGKFISASAEVSSDGLVLTNTMIWNSDADWQSMLADPVAQEGLITKSKAHLAAHGISEVNQPGVTF